MFRSLRTIPLQRRCCRKVIGRTAARLTSTWSFPKPPTTPTHTEVEKFGLPPLLRAAEHAEKDRILLTERPFDDGTYTTVSYRQALKGASQVSSFLQENIKSSKEETFVAQLSLPGWEYVSGLWGAWNSGSAFVPLALTQKAPELEHVLSDSRPEIILLGGHTTLGARPTRLAPNEKELIQAAENVGMANKLVMLQDILTTDYDDSVPMSEPPPQVGIDFDSAALVLYTSGTTGKPKGVVSTHRNIFHQVTDLVAAWHWHEDDVALHVLPLHHVHGLINLLCCAAYSGARLDFQSFDAERIWTEWANKNSKKAKHTVFMAVPTIYAKLLEAAESLPEEMVKEAVELSLSPMRLMVSGSAALPTSVLERWRDLTGHTLLERYGMTEFAMALSNPYRPVEQRHPGHVGLPLPSVQVKLIDEEFGATIDTPNTSGALHVKGSTVFREYLNSPKATAEAFDYDGYFDTGDVAEYNDEIDSYHIRGRASVDILKVGGHKLSALEIERDLLEHPSVAEVAIIGVADETWGERVGMLCRIKQGRQALTIDELRDWCEDRMDKYKIPSRLCCVSEIPKNAMGKINKKELVKFFNGSS